MPAPDLKWYISSTLIEAPQDLAEATPGTASTASSFDLWNDKDVSGADTASNYVLQILAQDDDGDYVASGVEALDNYWFEIQQFSGLGTLTLSAGSYQPLGSGRYVDVPTLASGQGVRYKLRVNAPGGPASGAEVAWRIVFFRRTANPLPVGIHEAIGPGVNLGVGDGAMTQLLEVSANVAENGGGADDKVQMPDVAWVAAGKPYRVLEHLLTFTNDDGASVALGAGESYYGLVYAKSDGTIAIEKGLKTTTPGVDDQPTLPEGGLALAMVLREADADGGDIETADITNTYVVEAAHFSSSSLTGSIGPYRIVNDNRISETSTATTVTLTDAATNRIWHLPDGSLSVTTTAALPESRAMLLWEAVTSGGVVTSSTDRRLFYASGYRIQRLDFLFDTTLAGGQKQRIGVPFTRTAYILPLGGVSMYLLANGDTSGATTIDINLRAPGGAFTTIFTSQGSEDRRPSIAHDSTNLEDTDAKPEVLAIPAHSLLEVEIDSVPGGSVPAWLNVAVLVACV